MSLDIGKLDRLEKECVYYKGVLDSEKLLVNQLLTQVDSGENEILLLEKVNEFFSSEISSKISSVKHRIEDIINEGLSYVYTDRSIKLSVESIFKNNKTQFSLYLIDGDIKSNKIKESFGGGVVSVVSFLFKVVTCFLSNSEKFMVFDETLNFVSKEYQENLSNFIKAFCKKMGCTIVLISHQKILTDSADIVYEAVSNYEGESRFTNFNKV